MNRMTEVYCWEDDPVEEELIEGLKKQGREFRVIHLDPEAGGGEPCVITSGKTYWSLEEALAALVS